MAVCHSCGLKTELVTNAFVTDRTVCVTGKLMRAYDPGLPLQIRSLSNSTRSPSPNGLLNGRSGGLLPQL